MGRKNKTELDKKQCFALFKKLGFTPKQCRSAWALMLAQRKSQRTRAWAKIKLSPQALRRLQDGEKAGKRLAERLLQFSAVDLHRIF